MRQAGHQSRLAALLVVGLLSVVGAMALPTFVGAASPPSGPGGSPSPAVAAGSPSPLGSPQSGSPSPLASESPSPTPSPTPTTVTCELSAKSVIYGKPVVVSGVVAPALAGQEVVISANGVDVKTAITDDTGAYSAKFTAARSCKVVARLAVDDTASPAIRLLVRPAVSVSHATAYPYLSTRHVVRVTPASYTGLIKATVTHRGVRMYRKSVRVRSGKAVFRIPLRGIGRFTVTFSLPTSNGLATRRVRTVVRTTYRTVRAGTKSPYARGLLTALRRLAIRVPYVGSTFNRNCADSLMAFQKEYGLPRTYVADRDDWLKLDTARRRKPRYKKPAIHIEVNKTRQTLMVVKNGVVHGLICVSTGATGNTREGAFRIQRKTAVTSPLSGSGALTWVMGFQGNFAIHGWPSVPPYPASHGCVREPVWVAYWVYSQSFVGERVYIYR